MSPVSGVQVVQVEANPEKPAAVTAVGTLQNLAAESSANKEAIRDAGGIAVLVSLVKDWPDTLVSPGITCRMTGTAGGRNRTGLLSMPIAAQSSGRV